MIYYQHLLPASITIKRRSIDSDLHFPAEIGHREQQEIVAARNVGLGRLSGGM